MSELVVVAGMHRSGTSALARLVSAMGVDFGREDAHLERAPDNPVGFWELKDVVAINNDLLRQLGGSWDRPPLQADDWHVDTTLEPLRKRAVALLDTSFDASSDLIGWKDPRGSLLLPFWSSICRDLKTIVIVRSPVEVAASLRRRNGFEEERAAALWIRYVTSALLDARSALIVQHEQLMLEPRAAANAVAEYLGLEASVAHETDVGAVVHPELHHERADPGAEISSPLMASAVALHEVISKLGLSAAPILGQYRLARDASDLKERLAVIEAEYAATSTRLVDTEERCSALEERRIEFEETSQAARRAIAARHELLVRAESAERRLAELEALAPPGENIAREIQRLKRRDKRASELAKKSAAQSIRADDLKRKLDIAQGEFDRLRARRSVRFALAMSRPLRPAVLAMRKLRS